MGGEGELPGGQDAGFVDGGAPFGEEALARPHGGAEASQVLGMHLAVDDSEAPHG